MPSVSAVPIRDVTTDADLYVDIDGLEPQTSELDDFRLASQNEPHTLMTTELGGWIVEQIGKLGQGLPENAGHSHSLRTVISTVASQRTSSVSYRVAPTWWRLRRLIPQSTA